MIAPLVSTAAVISAKFTVPGVNWPQVKSPGMTAAKAAEAVS